MSLRAVCLLSLLLLPRPGAAQSLEESFPRLEAANNDPAKVIEMLAPFSGSGDVRVEEGLAQAYFLRAVDGKAAGAPTAADIAPAIEAAQRALALGSGQAANLLYMIHNEGHGVAKDPARAVAFLRQAADLGDAGGKLNFAIALYEGGQPGLPRDIDAACPRMAELVSGSEVEAVAAYYVGQMMFKGECGKRADKVGGVELMLIAANHGWRDAERDSAKALEFGWAAAPDLAGALHWYDVAAGHGDAYSLWRIGMAHVNGEGRPKDPIAAVHWFERAVQAGGINGHASLGTMYATGEGVERDFAKARALYRIAADAGDAHSIHELAVMQILGEGEPVDAIAASVSYRQSLALGGREDPGLQERIDAGLDAAGRKEVDARFDRWRAEQR